MKKYIKMHSKYSLSIIFLLFISSIILSLSILLSGYLLEFLINPFSINKSIGVTGTLTVMLVSFIAFFIIAVLLRYIIDLLKVNLKAKILNKIQSDSATSITSSSIGIFKTYKKEEYLS